MTTLLLAQIAGWSLLNWAVFLIVAMGVVAILYIVSRKLGVQIPEWVVQIAWVVLVVVVAIFAVKLIMGML